MTDDAAIARFGSSRGPEDARIARVDELLRAQLLAMVRVRAAGRENEIAVLEADAAELPRLAHLAPAIKALGFRYVAIDLAHTDGADV